MEERRLAWTAAELAAEATRRGRPISAERIRQFCKTGQIPARKHGTVWMILDSAAQRWLERWLDE